jgi:dienelactone hydrolase
VTIPSEPAGAKVFRQAYNAPMDDWQELGITPLTDIHFPYGLSRLRFELDGYRPLLRALGGAHLNWAELGPIDPDILLVGPEVFRLDAADTLPPDMVRVPGFTFSDGQDKLEVRDFFIGRFEVTNAEFKEFVDAGGYDRPELWDPIVMDGHTVPWEQAMRLFLDRTGQPGPSTWEAGDYRDGEGNVPVSGVSWYEAAAYARFAGRELPTTHHWQQALANSMFPWLLPASNFAGQGPRPVAQSRAMSHVGAFDLTGNAREWTASAIGDERIILGGSWHDPYYIAGTNDASAPPSDRSPGNGIRLVITNDEPSVAARLRVPIHARTTVTTGAPQQPVSEAVHAAFARVFDYRRGPLDDSLEAEHRTRVWVRERVSFDAGYGTERVLLHLYLPTNASPPYQTVVYWPGWDTFALDDIDEYFAKQVDFIVKRGRALAFPVYRGTFERQVGNRRARPAFNTAEYRDNAIETVKELRRTIDYLETRPDIDARALAFFGYSWGGVNGPIALAHEPRLRTAIIDIGLLPPMSATPEVDPSNVLPRVRQPTLMLSGEFDHIVPVENARRYFELIGAPAADKRHVIAIGGHFIPRDLLIRETLDWLDKHLGPVSR